MKNKSFRESIAELYLLLHEIDMLSLRSYYRCCGQVLTPHQEAANDTIAIDDIWATHHYR